MEVAFVRAIAGPRAFGDAFPLVVRIVKELAHGRGWRLPGVAFEYSALQFALGTQVSLEQCGALRTGPEWAPGRLLRNVSGVLWWLLDRLCDGVLVHPFNGTNVLDPRDVPAAMQAAVALDLRELRTGGLSAVLRALCFELGASSTK
jgi:hypothetical protein